MNKFEGFQENKTIPIPAQLFYELLHQIDHLGELKLALYIFWRLEQMEGAFRYFRRQDIIKDVNFFESLNTSEQSAYDVLEEALQKGIKRGWLLEAQVNLKDLEKIYFINSPRGKAALQAIQNGDWRPTGDYDMPIALTGEPPNIFRLYEEHIGPLTPMLADSLRQAEQEYSPHWIEEAIRIAIENNVRNWRYVSAILKRWKDEGKDERKDRQDSEKARRRYSEWEDSSR
jgi:DNA replication protein